MKMVQGKMQQKIDKLFLSCPENSSLYTFSVFRDGKYHSVNVKHSLLFFRQYMLFILAQNSYLYLFFI